MHSIQIEQSTSDDPHQLRNASIRSRNKKYMWEKLVTCYGLQSPAIQKVKKNNLEKKTRQTQSYQNCYICFELRYHCWRTKKITAEGHFLQQGHIPHPCGTENVPGVTCAQGLRSGEDWRCGMVFGRGFWYLRGSTSQKKAELVGKIYDPHILSCGSCGWSKENAVSKEGWWWLVCSNSCEMARTIRIKFLKITRCLADTKPAKKRLSRLVSFVVYGADTSETSQTLRRSHSPPATPVVRTGWEQAPWRVRSPFRYSKGSRT